MAVSFLCHFPSTFAAWDFPSVLPCGVRTFLAPIVTGPPSAVSTAPKRMRASSPMLTSPQTTAVGATYAEAAICGRAPSCSISILEELRRLLSNLWGASLLRRDPPPERLRKHVVRIVCRSRSDAQRALAWVDS